MVPAFNALDTIVASQETRHSIVLIMIVFVMTVEEVQLVYYKPALVLHSQKHRTQLPSNGTLWIHDLLPLLVINLIYPE